MSRFKDVFKSLRIENGYTQRELAEKMGMSKSTVGMYEMGRREPDYETLEKIADFFNVDINYLLGKDTGSSYYFEPEVAQYAEFLRQNPDYRVLFDASRKVKAEDLEKAVRMLGIFTEE